MSIHRRTAGFGPPELRFDRPIPKPDLREPVAGVAAQHSRASGWLALSAGLALRYRAAMSLDERTARPPDPEHERFRGPAASRRDRPLPHGVSWVVGIAVAALLLAMTLAGARSSRDLGRARARTSELSSQIAEAEARIAELERRIELLRDDPVTLERLAREELGLVRPHDVVVVLPPQLRDEELASTGDGTGAETASARPAGTRGRDLQAEVP